MNKAMEGRLKDLYERRRLHLHQLSVIEEEIKELEERAGHETFCAHCGP